MAESQVKSREAKVDFEDDLEVVAQSPAPGPDPSDEKLDFDDDTLKVNNSSTKLGWTIRPCLTKMKTTAS